MSGLLCPLLVVNDVAFSFLRSTGWRRVLQVRDDNHVSEFEGYLAIASAPKADLFSSGMRESPRVSRRLRVLFGIRYGAGADESRR